MSAMTTAAPSRSLLAPLALQEGWRLLTHPVMLLGFVVLAAASSTGAIGDPGPRQAFSTVDSAPVFFPGMMAILVGHLAATRDLRAGASDLLGATPARPEDRTLALCLGAFVPAAATLTATLAIHAMHLALGHYAVAPSAIHLSQGAVAVFGACVLGIMVGTWLPQRGVVALTVVGVVILNAWLSGSAVSPRELFGAAMSWPAWEGDGSRWAGLSPGDVHWHVVYLVGLCGMAIAGALARAGLRPPLVAFAALTVAVATAGAIGQLP